MRLGDTLGSIISDPTHLHSFVTKWFRPGDNIVLVGIPVTGSRQVVSLVKTYEQLMETSSEDLHYLTFEKDRGRQMNTYFGINPLKDNNSVNLYSRGTKEDVCKIYGMFVDLDVKKDGAFTDKFEIKELLDSLELSPTLICDNGSEGGVHAYWRIKDEDLHRVEETMLRDWWVYVSSKTDKKIDKLIDMTRIARMPSGIYWPKEGSGGKTDSVRLVYSDGPEYSVDEITEVSEEAVREYQKKLESLRRKKHRYTNLKPISSGLGSIDINSIYVARELEKDGVEMDPKKFLLFRTIIEEKINQCVDWSEILEPHGWTYLKDQSDGSRVFSRPGDNKRSAVVDYVHDDGTVSPVMSLHSQSEATGLSDLKESGIHLTKYQVMLRLDYDDNEGKMISAEAEKITQE